MLITTSALDEKQPA